MRTTVLLCIFGCVGSALAEPWQRHTIDGTSRGADGVRLGDVNGDRLPDVTTGWEQGGLIRVYVNPGASQAKAPWPAVTVGQASSPEDAVFADVDGDGVLDVVSSCEGKERTMFVHWAPHDRELLLDPAAWRTEALPPTQKQQQWMYAVPLRVAGQRGMDLIVGAQGAGAGGSWLQAPADARDLSGWKLRPLYQAGWIMSLVGHDVDGDGDGDVVVSDRKGPRRGVLWLENPGADEPIGAAAPWREHRLGATGQEAMFLDLADVDGDQRADIICATRNGHIVFLRRIADTPDAWEERLIENPGGVPGGKSVRAADIDGDGRMDLVHTAELGGSRERPGVVWMSYRQSPSDPVWDVHNISGPEGNKFDLTQVLDLDGDGDLDVLACEERDNLGVFWYENPTKRAGAGDAP
jgi:hypothetical protein